MEVGIFIEREKTKSRVCCAVKDCQSKANENLDVVFHKFPKAGGTAVLVEYYFGNFEKINKLEARKKLFKNKWNYSSHESLLFTFKKKKRLFDIVRYFSIDFMGFFFYVTRLDGKRDNYGHIFIAFFADYFIHYQITTR